MQTLAIESHAVRPIDPLAVHQLYACVAWWPDRQAPDIAHVLAHDVAVGAWDGDRLVGFTRAVSDQRFRAYIEDVVVHPDYRRFGVGRSLVATVVAALGHIETISLFCDPDLVPFYEHHGFKASRSQVVLHRPHSSPGG